VREAAGAGEPIAAIRRAADAGGTGAAVVAGAIVGARVGAIGLPGAWRNAPDAVSVIEEVARTVSVAHRAYVMGRRIPGWEPLSDSLFEGHPASRWLMGRA
ncbi:MAG: hypothetical protein H0W07_01410, partial [Chloroflexi bacterium]|nr:hypothetical protein [Chloroflexota bacterium]